MPIITIEQAIVTLTTPLNLLLLGIMIIMLIVWGSARVWQTPEFVQNRARYFNPRITQILQQRFSSKFMDHFTTQAWFLVFFLTINLLWLISLFQGDQAWRYGLSILSAVITSMLIQVFFPVIVPIRYGDFGLEVPVRQIRFETFSGNSSERINGLIYNGLPSNHLGMVIAGLWLVLKINIIDPWDGWLMLAGFFILLGIIFIFTVLYLGEHFWQDLVAAFFVYSFMLLISSAFVDTFFPVST